MRDILKRLTLRDKILCVHRDHCEDLLLTSVAAGFNLYPAQS